MAETSNKKTPRDALRLVSRRWRLFLLGASLCAIAVMLVAHRVSRKYTGTTKFEHRRDVAAEGILERGSESFESIRLSIQNDLASRGAVAEVAEELGLLRKLPRDSEHRLTRSGEMAKQQIAKGLMKDIKVVFRTRSPNMDRVSVSVTHNDRKLAEQIPNVLVKNYKNYLLQVTKRSLTNSSKFLETGVNRCELRLAEITNEKIRFETKHAGMMPETPGALYDRLQGIDDNLDTLEKQQKADGLKIVRLKAQLAALGNPTIPVIAPTTQPADRSASQPTTQPADRSASQPTTQPADRSASQPTTQPADRPSGQPTTQPAGQPVEWVQELNPEKKRLEDQLWGFKEQLANAIALSHMTNKHPTVITLRAKIAELKKRIEKEPEWIMVRKTTRKPDNSIARRLAAQMILADIAAALSELEAAAKEKERLLKRRETIQVLMSNFAPVRQEYVQIIEKVKKQIGERDRWRKRLTEVQMALDAEMKGRRTHLNVLQTAEEQILPSSPKLLMVLGLAIISGLGIGGLLVWGANHWDQSVTTTDDARKYFNIPVFGATREITSSWQRTKRRAKRWILTPIVMIIVLVGLAASGLSITLWLEYPEKTYEEWKAAPISYVSDWVEDKAKEVSKLF